MLHIPQIMMALAALGVIVITIDITSHKGETRSNQICVGYCNSVELQLRKNAQEALDAIHSNRSLSASCKRAKRGQHVFNNRVLEFYRSVLKKLLKQVGGYDEQLENLMLVLITPLSITEQNAISTWVAHFSWDEHYVDFNADVFGEYVRQLRNALVEYLKADTSVNNNERYGIQETRRRVQFIANQMVNHEVYVDPMARDRWLQENQGVESRMQLYNQVRGSLRNMFQNILLDFKKVSDMIRVFRRRNKWNWDSDLK